jgi:uncharacterized protein YndB with AHSA1/START domain
MAHSSTVSITINAPAAKVWNVLMDPESMKHWLTGFISAEHLSGAAGEPGSRSRLKFLERGKETEVLETVTVSKPDQQYSFSMEHPAFSSQVDIRLRAMANSTELTQAMEMRPKGFLMKLMMTVAKAEMKRRMTSELEKLKEYVERQAEEI